MSEEVIADNAGGGSLLTEAPAAPDAGVPAAGAGSEVRADTVDAVREEVINGPPEHIPEKFWDHEKGEVRTEDLAKSYQNLEKLMSSEKVPVPTGEDDEEGWDRWHAANGRPEDMASYEIAEMPVMPEGMEYDERGEARLREYAFANGMNQRQFENLYNAEVKDRIEQHAHYQKAQLEHRAELQRGLQREYGDKFEAEVAVAKSAITKYGDPDFAQFLEDSGLGNDPRMIRFTNRIGKDLGGETKLTGKPQPSEMVEADQKSAIAKYRERNNKALMDNMHPEHARVTKELSGMYNDLHGTDPIR